MATHSSVLAWRIPGTGEPGGLLSMGSHRVGHNWSNLAAAAEQVGWHHFPTSICSLCVSEFILLRSASLTPRLRAYSVSSWDLYQCLIMVPGAACGSDHEFFLFLLAILWNSAFRWIYLSFSHFPFASLLFLAICKVSSDNHFSFLCFFFLGTVLTAASCTVLWTSIHSSSGTLSIRSNPLDLFVTSTV